MPTSPTAQLNLGDWLKHLAKEKFELSKRGEDVRTQVTVALHRRFRGATLSDRIGRFIPGGTGLWRGDVEGDLDGIELRCQNVVGAAVALNMSTLSSANVAITNEAANKDPKLKGAANVANGLFEYFDDNDEHWCGGLESRIMQMCQTGYGYFIRSRFNPQKQAEYVETQEWEDQEEAMPGEYACTCGSGGPFDSDGQNENIEQIPCPECGKQAEVVKAPEMAQIPKPGKRERFNPGDSETTVSSCLEHRIDERNSQSGNLDRANWFEHHYLTTDEELSEEFPKFQFAATDNAAWSYPIKWKWALETGDDVFSYNYQSDEFRKRRERRDMYLLPQEYSHRIEPEDWELRDGKGNVVFSIKRGERLIDKNPDGFCYSLVGDILAPYWRQVNFRQEWSYGCFMPDAHSFWGQPLVGLLQIQDDWNTLYTIDMQHRERNSLNQLTYYRDAFDFDDWNHDIVPSAEGWTLPDGRKMSDYWSQLNATPMTEAQSGLKLLFETLPYFGGAPPESIGADPGGRQGDNYSAQLLRKQSAMSRIQPASDSKANCKVRWFRNQLRIAQETWPEDRFEYIRTRFGEEWKDDDIEAFLNCNIDRDIDTYYVAGSEIPTTFIERRLDLEQVMRTYIDAGEVPPQKLQSQYFDLLDIDFDIGGIEQDERLADSRYQTIKQGLKELSGTLSDQPTQTIDPMSGMPVEGPSPLVQAVMSHPQLRVLPKEQHAVSIDFYVSRETAIMSQEMPEMPLIDCLEMMIQRHEMKGVEQGQTETASQVAVQQPAIAAAQSMQPAEEPQPDPAQEAQIASDLEAQKADAVSKEKSEDRDFQAADKQAQRDHEAAMKDKELNHQAQMEQLRIISSERIAKETAKEKAKDRAKQPAAA